jgi:hypothetical protein
MENSEKEKRNGFKKIHEKLQYFLVLARDSSR